MKRLLLTLFFALTFTLSLDVENKTLTVTEENQTTVYGVHDIEYDKPYEDGTPREPAEEIWEDGSFQTGLWTGCINHALCDNRSHVYLPIITR